MEKSDKNSGICIIKYNKKLKKIKEEYKMRKPDMSNIIRDLPPYVFRTNPKLHDLIGFSPKSLANMDCKGIGPRGRISIGGKVAYPREELIAWLLERAYIIETKWVQK
jgi:hypothetical protein